MSILQKIYTLKYFFSSKIFAGMEISRTFASAFGQKMVGGDQERVL